MDKRAEEWLAQAEYDLDTAEYMLKGGRCFYAVFMAHLSVEKALKGLWQTKLLSAPPKTHNLIFLVEKITAQFPTEIIEFLTTLNVASVPTRYPDDLKRMMDDYPGEEVREILAKAGETLKWIRTQL